MPETKTGARNPHPPEFEEFLYASVGEDRSGCAVTVLSVLARLGLDPWEETDQLVKMGHEAAESRVRLLLSKCKEVPRLASDCEMVALELCLLLPERPPASSMNLSGSGSAFAGPKASATILMLLGILFIIIQMMFTGMIGSTK